MDLSNFSGGTPSFEVNRKKTSPVPAFIVLILLAALGLFMGISGMMKSEQTLDDAFANGLDRSKCVSGVPAYGAHQPNFEYRHRIAGFVPLLNEYYYLIMPEGMDKGFLVRADKDFGENFASGTFENISGIEIKGNVKSTSRKVQENFSGMDYRIVDNAEYIDLLTTKMNIRWLIIGIYNALAVVLLIIHFAKNRGSAPATVVGKITAAVMFIGAFVCTYFLLGMIVQL